MAGPCGLAVSLLGEFEGACPALHPDGLGGYICGFGAGEDARSRAARVAVGSGIGCDSPQTMADLAARQRRAPEMRRQARADRERLNREDPEAAHHLVIWRLAPP